MILSLFFAYLIGVILAMMYAGFQVENIGPLYLMGVAVWPLIAVIACVYAVLRVPYQLGSKLSNMRGK